MTIIAKCASCDAPGIWVFTESGKSMLINAEPVPNGNLRLFPSKPSSTDPMGRYVPGSPPHVRVVTGTLDLLDPDDDGIRYTSHFATCPDAALWRAGRPAPATPGPERYRTMHRSF